ncbi:MAG: ferredoxin [Paenibacillus sp.]|jgi:2Fe-2S ferredoxin|nr:ferredoxin [Paenibacillus sp.]
MTVEITFLPNNKKIAVKPGTTILEAAGKARIQIRSRCGGNASCLMCKVTVGDSALLQPITENEARKLGDLAEQHIRLACQARVTGDVTVIIPEDPLRAAVRAQLAKQQEEDKLW